MAHLVPVKTHTSSMSGSQSLQDQKDSALGEGVSVSSPRPEMPRQNSDPTSDTPGPAARSAGREERDRDRDRDRDRTAWLREEDIPPKVETNNQKRCNEILLNLKTPARQMNAIKHGVLWSILIKKKDYTCFELFSKVVPGLFILFLCVQVPQRTTSISPALVRKNSPNGGVGLGPRTGSQLIRAR